MRSFFFLLAIPGARWLSNPAPGIAGFRLLISTGFIVAMASGSMAQALTAVYTRYDDSFGEWYFLTQEEEEGTLNLRWLFDQNWTEWDYRLGELSGSIETKWKDSPKEWELRGGNHIVTARTVWPDDFKEWRINDGSHTFTLRSRWSNRLDEWELRNSNYGHWAMYTVYEGDPRDWIVEEELDADIPFETRLMMAFLVLFHASPKQ